ncbi:MAG TPA: RNA polymerase sigma factor [Polyangiaceae bacterium]|nr:RNA polymerase sigma factor [Polyangiaceae bacterium]
MPLTLTLPLVLAVRATAPARPRPQRIDPTLSDGDLVRRMRGGDKWAEEALYHRHVRSVTRVVMRILARSVEAEDVVQDAFVIALKDVRNLRDADRFGEWLLSIAVRQVYRRFRRWKLLRAVGLDRGHDDATLAEQADPGASPETRAALAEIGRLLDALSAEERVAWVLRRVEGEKVDAIAGVCDCSRATVKRRIAKADSVIRARVEFAAPEDDDGGP